MTQTNAGTHRFRGQMASVFGNPEDPPSSYIWVSKEGNDNWNGSRAQPYLTLAAAVAVMTATRKTVIILPGTYTSAASIAVPVGLTDMLFTGISADHDSTMIRATAGDQVFLVQPNTTIGAANVLTFFANIQISAATGVKGVEIDNTNMTSGYKLITTFRDCGFGADTSANRSISIKHDDADSKIKTYLNGTGMGGNNIEGKVYVDHANAGDRFKATGMNFEGGIQFSTDSVASESEFYSCIMLDAGGAGGGAAQLIRADCCISRAGMTHEVATQYEFDDGSTSNYADLNLS